MLEIIPPPDGLGEEPDRFADLPHPREMLSLIGHAEAEAEFLQSLRSGRLHHAWLLTGEEGIGKATLAYRIARFMLAFGTEPQDLIGVDTLAVAASHGVAHQVASGGHPDLAIVRRTLNTNTKRPYTEIRAEDVRHGLEIFNKTAGAGGYRICIVDACDELNSHSANALLKTLEEPPVRSLFLLVAHRPGGLLPTIRSRCRTLPLKPLSTAEVLYGLTQMPGIDPVSDDIRIAAAEASGGSLRRGLAMLDEKKLEFIRAVTHALGALPALNGGLIDTIAEQTTGRNGDEAFERFCDLCENWMSNRIHAATTGGVDLRRLSEEWLTMTERRREIDALNLDRRSFVVTTFSGLARTLPRANLT